MQVRSSTNHSANHVPFYTRLVSRILFPLHEALKKHQSVRIRQRLEQSQWLSTDQLLQLQNQRLQQFMQHIARHVPYYRRLFADQGWAADHIKSVQDLTLLPFLTKAVIRAEFDQLKADDAAPLQRFNTGGSSGQPLTFLLGKARVSHDVAAKWRATRWWNVDIGDKEIVAWGSPIELNKQDRVKLWRDRLFRSTLIPAFDLTESRLLEFIHQIRQQRPRMLFGYPSVFHLIAQTAQQHHIDMTDCGIAVIFVTSERLYPYQRELIEQVFQAPVANGYGGRDAGFIAHQCPQGAMHISAEDIIVEIIDSAGNPVPEGVQGEIVVTHLATADFPFVRYRTGDIAAISHATCACGRGLPQLINLEGRSTDFVVASNGTMMHGLALIYVIRELQGIKNFKIIQHSKTKLEVQLVVEDHIEFTDAERIVDGMQARLGSDVTVEIHLLPNIAAEASGKYRYVISKVTG